MLIEPAGPGRLSNPCTRRGKRAAETVATSNRCAPRCAGG